MLLLSSSSASPPTSTALRLSEKASSPKELKLLLPLQSADPDPKPALERPKKPAAPLVEVVVGVQTLRLFDFLTISFGESRDSRGARPRIRSLLLNAPAPKLLKLLSKLQFNEPDPKPADERPRSPPPALVDLVEGAHKLAFVCPARPELLTGMIVLPVLLTGAAPPETATGALGLAPDEPETGLLPLPDDVPDGELAGTGLLGLPTGLEPEIGSEPLADTWAGLEEDGLLLPVGLPVLPLFEFPPTTGLELATGVLGVTFMGSIP